MKFNRSNNQPSSNAKPRLYYGYVIVLAAFLIFLVMIGIYYTFGIFFKAVLEEFNWTRAATSGAFSISIVVSGLSGIAMGVLTDRV